LRHAFCLLSFANALRVGGDRFSATAGAAERVEKDLRQFRSHPAECSGQVRLLRRDGADRRRRSTDISMPIANPARIPQAARARG
jgi:hypothetical protein